MKALARHFLTIPAIAIFLATGSMVSAQYSPFGATKVTTTENKTVIENKDGKQKAALQSLNLEQIIAAIKNVTKQNEFAGDLFKGFLRAVPVSTVKVNFVDKTAKHKRVEWFEKILELHGVKIRAQSQKTVKSKLFDQKSVLHPELYMAANYTIEGRAFVVEEIRKFYGGSVVYTGKVSLLDEPELANILALEEESQKIEETILGYEFGYDNQLLPFESITTEKGKLDMGIDISNTMYDFTVVEIPKQKKLLQKNQTRIVAALQEKAVQAMNEKKFNDSTVLLFPSEMFFTNQHGSAKNKDATSLKLQDYHICLSAETYIGMKEYARAIEQYTKLTDSAAYGSIARKQIEYCNNLMNNK